MEPSRKRFFAECGRAIAALILFCVMQIYSGLAVQWIGAGSYLALFPQSARLSSMFGAFVFWQSACLSLLFSSACTMTLLCAVFAARGSSFQKQTNAVPVRPRTLLLLFVLGMALNVAVTILFALLPIPEVLLSGYRASSAKLMTEPFAIRFLAIVVAAPLTEETILRGTVQNHLARVLPYGFAAVLQSLVFGLLHGAPLWIAYTFVFGLVCTLVYRKHGLFASVALHLGFNFLGVFL